MTKKPTKAVKPVKLVKATKTVKSVKRAVAVKTAPPKTIDPSGATSQVLDRLYTVVQDRRSADPALSHSARLLSRGTAKVAQKFGEEAVECLIEAVAGNAAGLIGESADVLYHLLVMWVDSGVEPTAVWAELERREGVSGIAEKAARPKTLAISPETRKIP